MSGRIAAVFVLVIALSSGVAVAPESGTATPAPTEQSVESANATLVAR